MYDAVYEAILSGETVIQASRFRKVYKRLCERDPETDVNSLEKQFEVRH